MWNDRSGQDRIGELALANKGRFCGVRSGSPLPSPSLIKPAGPNRHFLVRMVVALLRLESLYLWRRSLAAPALIVTVAASQWISLRAFHG